ncbi:MAG TPA: hypothetical protein VEQ60_26995, partial [Longimicrobium sp.]|nr:hypothetical protein [Longimicrobium sp.]
AALALALEAVTDPVSRLLVLEQRHRATLELFHQERCGEEVVAAVRAQWQGALAAVTDPVHRSLAAARALLAWEPAHRQALARDAVEHAARIADVPVRAEVLRALLPLASLYPATRARWKKLAKAIDAPVWRAWAWGRDSGAFRWLALGVEPSTPEFAAFTALHTRVLLEEGLAAMGAEDASEPGDLWTRCVRGEVPARTLVARGRVEAFDLTPVAAVALDELLRRDPAGEARELLPLCVNPGPQALAIASRWGADPDPFIARHGRLLCAEILEHVPRRHLRHWPELLHDRDDRTRFRATHCIRHPLVTSTWRRHRFGRLGVPYLMAWDQVMREAGAVDPAGANEMSWFLNDFVADSRPGLQALAGLAREATDEGERARRILGQMESPDDRCWAWLVQNLARETDPAIRQCLLQIVIRVAYRGALTPDRLRAVRAALRAPASAGLYEESYFVPAPGDYLSVYQSLWEAGGGAPVRRRAFIEAIQAKCQLRVADLAGETLDAATEACKRIALSHLYTSTTLVDELAGQVETRWAVAGLEFFLEWFADEGPAVSRPAGLQGDHRDHLLQVAAAISTRIPTLIRGNVTLPPGLEPRLREVAMHARGWMDRLAALELLGGISSAGPELLDCLVRSVMDTGAVRTTAFRLATRVRDVDRGFIEQVIARLEDDSGVVAYACGHLLANACMDGATSPEDKDLIIRALTHAKDSEKSRRTVYFEHHSRTNLPQLPRLDQHFARLLAKIWLGDQAATLRQSRTGWVVPAHPPTSTGGKAKA